MGVKTTDSASTAPTEEQQAAGGLPVASVANLPALIPAAPKRRPWLMTIALLLALIGAAGGGTYWWMHRQPGLPPGFAVGNGRLEADEIDIATKFPGRIAEVHADEGDLVKAGQVVARMDTKDLEANLRKAQAQAQQAQRALEEARAMVEQQKSIVTLARQQLDRTQALVPKGYATREEFDQRQQQLNAATALLSAANARVAEFEHALSAAQHEVDRDQVDIADNTLAVPRDGRIQYRLANVGEVLAAGGKVFTMLDTNYVYMDVFLPTADAGRVVTGADARIVLDALSNAPIPARVTFVAPQAQFTPKAVETRSERDKLMFRVRIRVDREQLQRHPADVRAGMPGLAYVRLDEQAHWPTALQGEPGG